MPHGNVFYAVVAIVMAGCIAAIVAQFKIGLKQHRARKARPSLVNHDTEEV